jgi:hypothetical protein
MEKERKFKALNCENRRLGVENLAPAMWMRPFTPLKPENS